MNIIEMKKIYEVFVKSKPYIKINDVPTKVILDRNKKNNKNH